MHAFSRASMMHAARTKSRRCISLFGVCNASQVMVWPADVSLQWIIIASTSQVIIAITLTFFNKFGPTADLLILVMASGFLGAAAGCSGSKCLLGMSATASTLVAVVYGIVDATGWLDMGDEVDHDHLSNASSIFNGKHCYMYDVDGKKNIALACERALSVLSGLLFVTLVRGN